MLRWKPSLSLLSLPEPHYEVKYSTVQYSTGEHGASQGARAEHGVSQSIIRDDSTGGARGFLYLCPGLGSYDSPTFRILAVPALLVLYSNIT
jgi:hypothetical protein